MDENKLNPLFAEQLPRKATPEQVENYLRRMQVSTEGKFRLLMKELTDLKTRVSTWEGS